MKVSWDDEIPNIWENKNVPNHQPEWDCSLQTNHFGDTTIYGNLLIAALKINEVDCPVSKSKPPSFGLAQGFFKMGNPQKTIYLI